MHASRRRWFARPLLTLCLFVWLCAGLYAAISVAAGYGNNNGGDATTSAAFNVTTDDLLVIAGHADQNNDNSPTPWGATPLTDNQAPDLVYTEIARRDSVETGAGAVIAWYHKVAAPITGLTITLTDGSGFADSPAIKVLKFASGDYDSADIVGAGTEGDLTTDPQTTASITPETNGTGVGIWTDWNQTGVPTSSDLTMTGFDTAGDISGGMGYKTLTTGVGATANINSGAAPTGNYLWFEIRGGAGAPATPKRLTTLGIGLLASMRRFFVPPQPTWGWQ